MYSALNMIWTHCEVYWALDFEPFEIFFYLDAAWLNEGRCPGGRPSVSEN